MKVEPAQKYGTDKTEISKFPFPKGGVIGNKE
jgi:hypothetical protein